MRKWISATILLCAMHVGIVFTSGAEEQVTVQELFQKVSDNYDKIKTLKATYTFKGYLDDKMFHEAKGNMLLYKAPDKLRINYEGSKKICSLYVNRVKIQRDPQTGKVTKEDLGEFGSTELLEDPGYWRDLKKYLDKFTDVSIVDRNGDIFILRIKPKASLQGELDGLIRIDYSRGVLRGIEYHDPGQDGKITRIETWDDFILLPGGAYYAKRFEHKDFIYDQRVGFPLLNTNNTIGDFEDIQANIPITDKDFIL